MNIEALKRLIEEVNLLRNEVARLKALTTPRPIATVPNDQRVLAFIPSHGWVMDAHHDMGWPESYTHWLPVPPDPTP